MPISETWSYVLSTEISSREISYAYWRAKNIYLLSYPKETLLPLPIEL